MAAAGIGIAALPVAVEQIAKRVAPKVSDLGEQAKDKISDVSPDLGEAAKQVAKGAAVSKLKSRTKAALLSKLKPGSSEDEGGGLLSKLKPGSSDEGDDKGRAAPGHGGSGRRMPIQQSVDVAVPIKVAYNRWTQFEDWPEFMHRFEGGRPGRTIRPSPSRSKMWGLTRRFEAEIVEQRPRRADRVERHRGSLSHGRGHLPRARPPPDQDRGQP